MIIKEIKDLKYDNIYSQIKELLFACDKEFVPYLSARNSSTQDNLKQKKEGYLNEAPITYFKQMIQQDFIIAVEDAALLGFLTFIPNYENDIFNNYVTEDNNMYVTTICVDTKYRGRGIATKLYEELEEKMLKEKRTCISTRTWSTNISHIKILERKGFENICTLKDHRGKGIDTKYYLKK